MSEFVEDDWIYTGRQDPPLDLGIEVWDDIDLCVRQGELHTDGRYYWWEIGTDASVYDKYEYWRYKQ